MLVLDLVQTLAFGGVAFNRFSREYGYAFDVLPALFSVSRTVTYSTRPVVGFECTRREPSAIEPVTGDIYTYLKITTAGGCPGGTNSVTRVFAEGFPLYGEKDGPLTTEGAAFCTTGA